MLRRYQNKDLSRLQYQFIIQYRILIPTIHTGVPTRTEPERRGYGDDDDDGDDKSNRAPGTMVPF